MELVMAETTIEKINEEIRLDAAAAILRAERAMLSMGAAEIVGQMLVVPCFKWKLQPATISSTLPSKGFPPPPCVWISIKPALT